MAESNGITVVPTSGQTTGNQNLTISASPVTGRLENSSGQMVGRSAAFGATGTGQYSSVASSNTLMVRQNGASPFLSITTQSDVNAFSASGGPLVYSGKSNFKTITLTSGTSGYTSLVNSLTSATITAGSTTYTPTLQQLLSGYLVPGDPGNNEQYDVSFEFSVPTNGDSEEKHYSFGFTGVQGNYDITQSYAQTSYSLAFALNGSTSSNPLTIEADAAGTVTTQGTISVVATEGLNWSISESNN